MSSYEGIDVLIVMLQDVACVAIVMYAMGAYVTWKRLGDVLAFKIGRGDFGWVLTAQSTRALYLYVCFACADVSFLSCTQSKAVGHYGGEHCNVCADNDDDGHWVGEACAVCKKTWVCIRE